MEFGAAARRGREAEITTRNYRRTSAISFQLLRLSFLRARIHIFWREQVPQLPLAFAKYSRVTGICRKVRCFTLRVCSAPRRVRQESPRPCHVFAIEITDKRAMRRTTDA